MTVTNKEALEFDKMLNRFKKQSEQEMSTNQGG